MNDGYKEVRIGPKKVEIPEEWDIIEMSKIFEPIDGDRGKNYPSNNELFEEGHCLFLSAKNVTKDGFEFNENKFISKEKDEELRKGKISENDIVMTTRGTVGNFALYDSDIHFEDLRINSGMVILRPKTNSIDLNYYYNLFNSNFFQNQIDRKTYGSAQPQLSVKVIRKLKLFDISLHEQRRIAEILSTVDEAIQKTDEIIEKAEGLKKGLMQDLLTKGIGHTEFKEVQIGPKTVEIPVEWEVDEITKVCEINPRSFNPSNHKENSFEYIDIESVSKNKITKSKTISIENAPSRARRKIKEGDILVSTVRPYLQGFSQVDEKYDECVCSTGFAVLKVKDNFISDYVLQVVLAEYFLNQMVVRMTGTNYPAVNNNDFKTIRILCPPLPEQRRISKILSKIDKKIKKEKSYKQKLQSLKRGLMQDLLTGKVRVNA